MIGFAKLLLIVCLTLTTVSGFSTYLMLQPGSNGLIEMSGDSDLIARARAKVAYTRDHLFQKVFELTVCGSLGFLLFFLAGEDRTRRSFRATAIAAAVLLIALSAVQSWLPAGLYFLALVLVVLE